MCPGICVNGGEGGLPGQGNAERRTTNKFLDYSPRADGDLVQLRYEGLERVRGRMRIFKVGFEGAQKFESREVQERGLWIIW
jgi:hypothetical protein